MTTEKAINEHLARLVDEGQQILARAPHNGLGRPIVPDNEYLKFRTEAMNLIRRSCGADSDHYKGLKHLAEDPKSSHDSTYMPHCLGVVEAAKKDFARGLLFDMRALISAEILGDFIDQADALLAAGYHQAAASLAGAVLEDTLRKLCEKHSIPVPSSTKIDSLNATLARESIYDKLVQKRITALADIRNNADHGHWEKFTTDDVDDMVKWTRRFAADYLK